MNGFYWIKLHHSLLDDPRFGTLPDRLYRRLIELYLLAGKHSEEGRLPDDSTLAWELRLAVADLRSDLEELERAGHLQRLESGWLLVDFTASQAPANGAERVRAHRQRAQAIHSKHINNDVCNEGVTVRYADKESESESDIENMSVQRVEEDEKTKRNAPDAPDEFDEPAALVSGSAIVMRLLMLGTGMPAVPPSWFEKRSDIESVLLALYYQDGEEMTVERIRHVIDAWVGRNYNKANPGWVDWLVAGIPARAAPVAAAPPGKNGNYRPTIDIRQQIKDRLAAGTNGNAG